MIDLNFQQSSLLKKRNSAKYDEIIPKRIITLTVQSRSWLESFYNGSKLNRKLDSGEVKLIKVNDLASSNMISDYDHVRWKLCFFLKNVTCREKGQRLMKRNHLFLFFLFLRSYACKHLMTSSYTSAPHSKHRQKALFSRKRLICQPLTCPTNSL